MYSRVGRAAVEGDSIVECRAGFPHVKPRFYRQETQELVLEAGVKKNIKADVMRLDISSSDSSPQNYVIGWRNPGKCDDDGRRAAIRP